MHVQTNLSINQYTDRKNAVQDRYMSSDWSIAISEHCLGTGRDPVRRFLSGRDGIRYQRDGTGLDFENICRDGTGWEFLGTGPDRMEFLRVGTG